MAPGSYVNAIVTVEWPDSIVLITLLATNWPWVFGICNHCGVMTACSRT